VGFGNSANTMEGLGGGYRASGTIGRAEGMSEINFLYKRGVSEFHLVQFDIILLLIIDANVVDSHRPGAMHIAHVEIAH
jgi:hypothetical protein